MKTPTSTLRGKQGFTLVELSIASTLMVTVVAGAISLFLVIQNSWSTASLHLQSSSKASRALTRMVYGAGSDRTGIRAAYREDVNLNQTGDGGWRLSLSTNITETLVYTPADSNIVTQTGFVIADNVVTSTAALASGGCNLSLTIREAGRRQEATTTMSTYVKFRNQYVLP